MRFKRGIRSTSNDERVVRISLVGILVIRLRRGKISFRRVQIAESKIRREVFGMCSGSAREICLREFCVSLVARQIAERRKRGAVIGIETENLGEGIARRIFLPQLPLQ